MDKGYIENGFIIDLTAARKNSEIIYELSRILDMPEAKGRLICLKLGSVSLSQEELLSVKAQIELMESTLACISTSSVETLDAATALDIKISEFTNEIEAPAFEAPETTGEIVQALDNIFGDESEISTVTEHVTEQVAQIVSEQAPEHVSDERVGEIITNDSESVSQVTVEKDDSEEVIEKKMEAEKLPTVYLRKTIRSGQSISSDGNIIVIGDVNPGAEIIAKGDITVWGILGGIAHAGSNGNEYARIRALKLNPVQIRIGDTFARRPDTVNIPYVQKSSEYVPEEAYAYKGSIVIRKFHEEN